MAHIPTLVERAGTTTDTTSITSSSNTPVSGKAYTITAVSRLNSPSSLDRPDP